MGARERIEQHSIFLQKLAYRILSDDNIRLATIGKLVGDHGIFDRDMSSILMLLYAHDNLASPQVRNNEDQPYYLLYQIAKNLLSRNFYLPSFGRRFSHIEGITNSTFKRVDSNPVGGEAGSLDKPLRSLREKMYDIRLNADGHVTDGDNNNLTTHTGEDTIKLVEKLILSIKSMDTEGLPYRSTNNSDRVNTDRTEFLDARYDELSTKFNKATGSTDEGSFIPLLHLHPVSKRKDPEWDDVWYAVKEEDFSPLVEAVKSARSGWEPENSYVYPSELLGADPGEDAADAIKEAHKLESDTLAAFSQEGSTGDPVVRIIRLPFAPDQIDDDYPTLELAEDQHVGENITSVTLENINRMRFAGFVDFDNNYRMMIMWANAADDKDTDMMGRTYRDLLVRVLGVYKPKMADVLGMEPEVHRTKSGAAYYFPRPISISHVVESFNEVRNLIDKVNGTIEHQEVSLSLDRAFNRDISDDELPPHMEKSV